MNIKMGYVAIGMILLSGCSTIIHPTSPENLGILINQYVRHDNVVAFKNLFSEGHQEEAEETLKKLKPSVNNSSGHEQTLYEILTFDDGKKYLVYFSPSIEKIGDYEIIKIIELTEEQTELLNSIWEE